jgi:hypothetical protein
MTPNELLTKEDLENFKLELFERLKPLLESPALSSQKWLRNKDVRKLLGISNGTLHNMRISSDLKFKKIGGIYYYSQEQVEKMLTAPEKKSSKKKQS